MSAPPSGWTKLAWPTAAREVLSGLVTVGLTGGHPSLPGRLRWHARRRPDDPAFTDAEGTLSWAGLANEVAARAASITRSDSLIVSCHDSRSTLVMALAGLSVGATVRLRNPRLSVDADPTDAPSHHSSRTAPGPGRLVVHTSGSTRAARAVSTRWGAMVALQQLSLIGRLPLRDVATVGVMLPLDRGHGFGTAAFCLAAGVHLVDLRRSSGVALGVVDTPVVTALPEQLPRLLDERPTGIADLICGSELLDPALVQRVTGELKARVWNCYGLTETGTVCVATPDDLRHQPGTVGRPLAGVTVRAVDGLLEVRSPQSSGRTLVHDRGEITGAGLVLVHGRA